MHPSQVILDSLSSISQLYLSLSPSPQRLPQFVADITLVVSTCFRLCQPIQMTGHRHYVHIEDVATTRSPALRHSNPQFPGWGGESKLHVYGAVVEKGHVVGVLI